MKFKIKESVMVLLSVCIVFAGIIVGLYYLQPSITASKFTRGFYYGLLVMRGTTKPIYWACAFSSILIFATAVIDAILNQRILLSPLLSAVAFLLTLIPFVINSYIHIPIEWFIAVVLAVYAFSIVLSLRMMSRLSLGMGGGIISLLRHPNQVKENYKLGTVDKAFGMVLFCLMFLMFLFDLVLLGYHLVTNRQIMFHV